MLKKEFKRKDVERMRNLITGNADSSSETQIGYKKKIIERKEGDVWTENKKTWTIKNGIKKTISKLNSVRKEVFMPLSCPKCKKIMKKHLDKPNYKIHKMCLDCVIDFEAKLKYKGKYKQYVKELITKNKITNIKQVESYLLDLVNSSNSQYISEDGTIERWVGGIDTKNFKKNIKNQSKNIQKELKKELDGSESKKIS